MVNIIANPSIGLLFMVPGFDDTLRVNGRAQLTTNASLLTEMAIKDRVPKIAIVLHVEEAFLHCAKAFRRSHLWSPDALQDRSEMPSLGQIIMEQTTDAELTKEQIDHADEIGRALLSEAIVLRVWEEKQNRFSYEADCSSIIFCIAIKNCATSCSEL